MGRDMADADSFRVGIGEVAPVPGLGPDQGWVGMTVQFLVDAAGAGSEHVVFGRAVFAPGEAEHQWHRHPGAEEFVLTPGTALTFDSSEPHLLVNEGTEPAEGIWFVLGRRLTPESHHARLVTPGDGAVIRHLHGRD